MGIAQNLFSTFSASPRLAAHQAAKPHQLCRKLHCLNINKSSEANNFKPNEQGGNSPGSDLCGGTGGIGQIISVGANTITI